HGRPRRRGPGRPPRRARRVPPHRRHPRRPGGAAVTSTRAFAGTAGGDGAEFLGLGGRLEAAAGEDLVAAGFALEMADAKLLHDGFGLADLAHVLALADAGVLAEDDAGVLVGALLEMAAVPADEFPYDAAYGD